MSEHVYSVLLACILIHSSLFPPPLFFLCFISQDAGRYKHRPQALLPPSSSSSLLPPSSSSSSSLLPPSLLLLLSWFCTVFSLCFDEWKKRKEGERERGEDGGPTRWADEGEGHGQGHKCAHLHNLPSPSPYPPLLPCSPSSFTFLSPFFLLSREGDRLRSSPSPEERESAGMCPHVCVCVCHEKCTHIFGFFFCVCWYVPFANAVRSSCFCRLLCISFFLSSPSFSSQM